LTKINVIDLKKSVPCALGNRNVKIGPVYLIVKISIKVGTGAFRVGGRAALRQRVYSLHQNDAVPCGFGSRSTGFKRASTFIPEIK
jgi:hypothetical protein